MTISLKHSKTSAIADIGDSDLVQPSDWNDDHNLTQASDRILGRITSGSGSTEELTEANVKTILGFPTSTTDNTIPRFDSIAGDLQSSGVAIDDSDEMSGATIDSANNTLTMDLSEGTLAATFSELNTAVSDADIISRNGSVTANYLSKWVSDTEIAQALLYDDGTGVALGHLSPSYLFDQRETFTHTSGTEYSVYVNSTFTPSSDGTGGLYGGYFTTVGNGANDASVMAGARYNCTYSGTGTLSQVIGLYATAFNNSASSTITHVYGCSGIGYNLSTGTTTNVYGANFAAQNQSTGSVGNAYGFLGTVRNSSTGTITSAYGGSFSLGSNAGTITNTYGVHIGDVTTGTQTNQAYGLYQADANARNYFAGELNCDAQVGFGSYTVATVPSASTAGQMIYVSDETGGAVMAFSDGTNWRRVTDRAVVS